MKDGPQAAPGLCSLHSQVWEDTNTASTLYTPLAHDMPRRDVHRRSTTVASFSAQIRSNKQCRRQVRPRNNLLRNARIVNEGTTNSTASSRIKALKTTIAQMLHFFPWLLLKLVTMLRNGTSLIITTLFFPSPDERNASEELALFFGISSSQSRQPHAMQGTQVSGERVASLSRNSSGRTPTSASLQGPISIDVCIWCTNSTLKNSIPFREVATQNSWLQGCAETDVVPDRNTRHFR